MRTVTVGVLVPDANAGVALRSQVRATGLGSVVVEAREYPKSRSDATARKFIDAKPDLILIVADDPSVAEESVRALRAAMPAVWIVACMGASDERVRLEVIRAGAYQILLTPMTSEVLAQSLRQVQLLNDVIEARERERKGEAAVKGEVYAVCAGKRGAGATTIAINLAAALAENGAKTALVDLDWPIGDIASYLNIVSRFNISEALSSADRLDAVLLESYMHKFEQLHVLSGLEEFETRKSPDLEAMSQLIEILTQNYRYTVIDLSLFYDQGLVDTVVRLSNAVLAVITPELPSLRRAERLFRYLGYAETSDKIRLVLNRTTKTDEITERDIRKALNHSVSWKVSNDYRVCKEAINAGRTVLSSRHLGRDFREMARQLTGVEPEGGQRKGLLSLLPKPSMF